MSSSPVIAFLNKMTDLILLNIIFIVCCAPVFTIGAAVTAMYYVCITSIRLGDGYVVKRFFKSFKKNFGQATLIWLFMMTIWLIMGFDLFFWYRLQITISKVMFILSMIVAFVVLIISIYVFPVLAKLEGNIKTTIKNAAAFAIGYFPYSLIQFFLIVIFVYTNMVSVRMKTITVFIGFALLSYIRSFFVYRIMMNHIDEGYDDFMDQ